LPNIPSPTKGIESLHNDLPELYDSPYYEAYITLTNTGLDPKIARQAIEYCINLFHAQGFIEADRLKVANIGLSYTLQQLLHFSEDPTVSSDTLTSPNGIVFIGPTGVGKTTTLAKIAAHVSLRVRQRVELITLDTYRIAAIEQLKTYAEIIGAGFHVAHSVVELNALTTRLAGKGLMLIDTAGRSPNDLADQLELANYLKEDCSLLKCLVLQATTHPIDADLAVKKFSLYGPDQLVLTKLDETARPGASVSIAMNSKLPLTYLCAGQKIPNDINLADCKTFTNHILRASLSVN
jgi:flagellar biosynthesis protein FlhF